MRDRAGTVIIGAGIVGTSAAYHLAELGEADVFVIDQGPLFETGGSTSHAPGLVFQINGSRAMCKIAQETVRLYNSLDLDGEPCFYPVGGIEIATTPERMQELRRRLGYARSFGLDGVELLSPAETVAYEPLLDPATILGALHIPGDGIAKAVRAATALARAAEASGVEFQGGVKVTGFDIRDGRVHGVRTDHGDIECERVLMCAGLWGPTVGAMAGVPVPLVAVQHQLVWTDPVPALAGETREVVHPILRHQDHSMYFRHREDHYGVGNYRHEPRITQQSAIRTPGNGPQPSLMPFTPEDFVSARTETERLMPELAGTLEPADPRRSLNGMFSFTPDGGSIVGEASGVRGFWVCEAVWVTHGGGMGKMVAEWMTAGEPSFDISEADANRFYPFMTEAPYVEARGGQQYREVYDILHPLQQMNSPRDIRVSPFHAQQVALGAHFFSGAGWERPHWFESNAAVNSLAAAEDVLWASRNDWSAQNWSPAVGVEHVWVRQGVGLFDLTPFVKLRVYGADAAAFLDRASANTIADRAVGSVTYTAMLTPSGGIRCDLTVTSVADTEFQVVTGAGSGMHDLAWLRAQVRDSDDVTIDDVTTDRFCLGLWGPDARKVLAAATADDVSNDAFPYLTARTITLGDTHVLAQRISYAGELGWELYGPMASGSVIWDLLWAAGEPHAIIAAGNGAFDSLRMEKGYRLWGQDLDTEHDPYAAGLGFAVKLDAHEFQGREALRAIRDQGPRKRLACITLDDPHSVIIGKEPIWHDGSVVGYVTSASYGYTVGRAIAFGYLPAALVTEGTALQIEYFGERLAATVAADPLWDPKGERQKV